ncbi:MAG: monofunctional biosynthetic peptidoglycan transglycosylase [Bacteroidota bacterium]
MAQNTYKNKQSGSSKSASKKKSWFKRLFSGGSKQKSSLKDKFFGFIWKAIVWFFGLSLLAVILLKFIPILFTPTMLDRKITALLKGENSDIYYDWKPYSEISKEAALAVVAAEDQFFPVHTGFDFKAMNKAFQGNLKGKRLKGASTISQQVAKNVFLWQNRDYIRKGLEVYFTLMIELIWGKERILEVYLNVAETGKMTFGFEEGSKKYFGHSAATLSRTEAAKMAAVLPNPIRFSVTKPSNYIQRRSSFIARQMRGLGGKAYLKGL